MKTLGVLAIVAVATAIATVVTARRSVHDPADIRGPVSAARQAANRRGWLRRVLRRRVDPTKATGLALTVAAMAVVGATIVVGSILEMVQNNVGFARFDKSAAQFGATNMTGTATDVFRLITHLGATRYIAVLALAVALVEHRRRPAMALNGLLAVSIIGTVAITNLVKVLVDRERPDISRLVDAYGSSFPSGHTAAAAAAYAAFALILGRGRSRRAKVGLAAATTTITATVAGSRVLLGVHWLTDVIAGAALGWGWFALTSIMFGGRLLHFGEPIEELQISVGWTDTEGAAATGQVSGP